MEQQVCIKESHDAECSSNEQLQSCESNEATEHEKCFRDEKVWQESLTNAWRQSLGDFGECVILQTTNSVTDHMPAKEVVCDSSIGAAASNSKTYMLERHELKHASNSKLEKYEPTPCINNTELCIGEGNSSKCSECSFDEQTNNSHEILKNVKGTEVEMETSSEDCGNLNCGSTTLNKTTPSPSNSMKFELSHWSRSSEHTRSVRHTKVPTKNITRSVSFDTNIQQRYSAFMEQHIKELKGN